MTQRGPSKPATAQTNAAASSARNGQLDVDSLFSAAYEELRRIARSVKYSGPEATVTPSTLVNEAWIRLAKSCPLKMDSELHFKRIAAQAMRRVLVEAARRRWALKRGGGESSAFITFDESLHVPACGDRDLLALDAALDELANVSPRQSALVDVRFFGGLDVAETASVLNVSESTVLREWRAAKAWLASQIQRTR